MAETFLALNKVEELYVLPIPEPEAGTAWKKRFAVSASNAEPGAVGIVINGQLFEAAVTAGADAQAVAAAIVARINSELTLPVTAEVDAENPEFLIVTCNVKGTVGNGNSVGMESTAPGVSVEEGATTAGTGVTNIKPFLTGLGETRYNFFASDFGDASSLKYSSDELESRYEAMRQIGGRMYVALDGPLGSKTEAGSMLHKAKDEAMIKICGYSV